MDSGENEHGERKPTKIVFEGVSPDLLRATAPTPKINGHGTPSRKALESDLPPPPALAEVAFSKAPRLTGEDYDPYGLRQGKQSCLRSVLERIRGGRMSVVEEARAMNFLLENGVVDSQAELATIMEKPKSKVSEKLSILKLPKSVLLLMERHADVITEGHAIELLRLKDEALISNVATRIVEQGLTRDRLRTEIAFLLQKHGAKIEAKGKRTGSNKTYTRYFPRVDGGFDVIYRFRPEGDSRDLEKMVADMEAKLTYLKKVQIAALIRHNGEHIEEVLKEISTAPALTCSARGS